ncbi:MAG TPA: ABC transporter permease [archaeon]|nr:ABC transporter permease [archaeon]
MATFVGKRILSTMGVLLGVVAILFLLFRVAVPDPAKVWAGPRASQQTLEALTVRFHLDAPLYLQFYYYLNDLLHGDWGVSPISGQPVFQSITQYFPATAELTTAALILTVVIGIPLGVVAATHRNKVEDHLARVTSLTGIASPPFLLALILQFVFVFYLRVFPDSGGRISVFIATPPQVTGFLTIDSLIAGDWPAFASALQHLVLPSLALAFLTLGLMSRLMRASLLEALASDYVRTAKAKGLRKWIVVYKHALRNALAQPVTGLAVYVAYLLGGSVVVENIFSWPGIGRYAAQAALNFDFPAIMGTTIVFAVCVVVMNLVADVLLCLIDPRIRLG